MHSPSERVVVICNGHFTHTNKNTTSRQPGKARAPATRPAETIGPHLALCRRRHIHTHACRSLRAPLFLPLLRPPCARNVRAVMPPRTKNMKADPK